MIVVKSSFVCVCEKYKYECAALQYCMKPGTGRYYEFISPSAHFRFLLTKAFNTLYSELYFKFQDGI